MKASFYPERYDLETFDQTGAQPVRLAGGGFRKRPLPEWFVAPSWSPDGSKIVFVALAGREDRGPRAVRLYVSEPDGSGLRPLRGTHGADEPVFAPNGATVAFTRFRFRSKINRRGKRVSVAKGASIWFADLSGGAPRRMTPARDGLYMFPKSFSPDGNTLLASRAVGSRPWEAVRMRLDTGKVKVLLRNAVDPLYSPDGSRIALVRYRRLEHRRASTSVSFDLVTMRADGGGVRWLTSGPSNDYFQSWDPSGERLAFVRYRPEVTEFDELGFGSAVMEMNADGTCLRTVLPASPLIAFYGASWQPGPGKEAGRIAC